MTAPSPILSGAPVLRRIALLLGWLSVFATLALLSPGVVATASAEEVADGRALRVRSPARPTSTRRRSCPR